MIGTKVNPWCKPILRLIREFFSLTPTLTKQHILIKDNTEDQKAIEIRLIRKNDHIMVSTIL